MKKIILTISAAILLTASLGVASAAPATVSSQKVEKVAINKLLKYKIYLKSGVGDSKQIATGRKYHYYVNEYAPGGPYFTVSSTGLVKSTDKRPNTIYDEACGTINVVDAYGNEIEEVDVVIDSF